MINYTDLSAYEKELINKVVDRFTLDTVYVQFRDKIARIVHEDNWSLVLERKLTSIHINILTNQFVERITDFFVENDFVKKRINGAEYDRLSKGDELRKSGSIEKLYEKEKTPQEILRERADKRYALLTAVYNFTNGELNRYVDLRALAQRDLLYDSDFDSHYRWLLERKFIVLYGMGYTVRLGPNGRDEIEYRLGIPENGSIEPVKILGGENSPYKFDIPKEVKVSDAFEEGEGAPVVFISYSWDSPQHENWIINLATKLRENGVDAILDKWDLGDLGILLPNFMEKSISQSRRVICVMTPNYKKKTEDLSGGVGFEYSIISASIFADGANTTKFIPLFRSGSEIDAIPTSLTGRKYVDMRDDAEFEEKFFHELLRDIYQEPRFKKPPIGKKPIFD